MPYLRQDRIPHIWCPGCGIGTTVNCFARALTDSKMDLDKVAIVSGIGCTGRVAGYMNLDSFHTTHGRPIPFATGLKLANPDLKVVVYSGDGDLTAIGGNHFIHAARRNMDLMVVCVNNFTYGMTGGQVAPTTPPGATQTTTPFGNYENPFNLAHLADACGAVYVARWTVYHVKQLAKAMLDAIVESALPEDDLAVVSGIGCTARVPGYLRLDSFHTTHGRALPYATGLHLANPKLKVMVVSGDGDLFAIGGNHFIHAARRNVDLLVVCVNNFTYGMTGGQAGPTTPTGHRSTTTPGGNWETPFNLPNLAAAAGAVYVARWTTLHARPLQATILEALRRPGFRFIEVIAPCPTAYGRRNKLGEAVEMMKRFHEKSEIRHGANVQEVDIDPEGTLVVGRFVDRPRPTLAERLGIAPKDEAK
jgi:2-oxoglutarate ferredoxin oxidoreductase subunit beta